VLACSERRYYTLCSPMCLSKSFRWATSSVSLTERFAYLADPAEIDIDKRLLTIRKALVEKENFAEDFHRMHMRTSLKVTDPT